MRYSIVSELRNFNPVHEISLYITLFVCSLRKKYLIKFVEQDEYESKKIGIVSFDNIVNTTILSVSTATIVTTFENDIMSSLVLYFTTS